MSDMKLVFVDSEESFFSELCDSTYVPANVGELVLVRRGCGYYVGKVKARAYVEKGSDVADLINRMNKELPLSRVISNITEDEFAIEGSKDDVCND